jgi:hypothetical protein
MATPENYVLLSARGETASQHFWNAAALAGVSLRRTWAEMNPRPGEYDFGYFDRETAAAGRAGKKIMLRVLTGVNAPDWIYQAGARPLRFTDRRRGDFTMPVPWDRAMLDGWGKFIRELGKRYRSQPRLAVVHLSGPTRFSAEMHLPIEVTSLPDWSVARLVGAWKETIDLFALAFPQAPLALNLAHPVGRRDGIADFVVDYLTSQLGGRARLQHNALAAKTSRRYDIHQRILAASAKGIKIGFQMLCASSEPRFGGSFARAIEIGNEAHPLYYEIYPPDVGQLRA